MSIVRPLILPICYLFLLYIGLVKAVWASDIHDTYQKSIVAVIPESFPPYYQLNTYGEPEGFAIDVMDALSRRTGLEVNYKVKKSWKDVFASIKAGEGDLIPNVGATKARAEFLDFSHSVETFNIALFIRAGSTSKIQDLSDLKGKKIGGVKTNIGFKIISKNKQIEAVAFDSFEQAFYALLSGQVEALAYPDSVGWKSLVEVHQERSVAVLSEPLKEIKRVIGVHKGNDKLVQSLNHAIDELVRSDEYPVIYKRWFAEAPELWTIDRLLVVFLILITTLFIVVIVWRYQLLRKHKTILDQEVRKQTEELNLTNKLLQDVLDNIPARVFWKDLNNVFMGCNKAFVGDAGVSSIGEVIGKTDYDFSWKDRAEDYRNDDSAVMVSGVPKLHFEEAQTTPDGNTIWLETSKVPLKKNDDSTYGVLGVYEDITSRKKMEEALTESKEMYAIAETIAHIGSWNWDIEADVIVWSDEIFRIFGIEPGSIQPSFDFLINSMPEEDGERVQNAVQAALEDENVIYDLEHKIIQADGTEITVHQQGKVFRNKEGKALSMVGTTHDITAKKKAELAFMLARDEAELANKAKSEFLSNMSHELRTPLHGILSYAQFGISKSDKVDAKKIKKYFSQINSSGERLKILLDDLLDISKLEAGKMELIFDDINIVEIIESCIAEQNALMRQKGIKAGLILQTDELILHCDKNRIGQVVMNVLSNAIKFSPNEGEIEVKINSIQEKDKKFIEVSIADQGNGVEEKDRERVFEKFVQSKKNEDIEGTGLGLAITRELINAHNGKVWCQSSVSGGAEFVFVLPVNI